MKILVLGDSHIPLRSKALPDKFMRLLKTQKFNFTLFTGDFTSKEVFNTLKRYCKIYATLGNMDNIDLPKELIINAHGFKIGLIHGHKIKPRGDIGKLTKYAKEKDVDILVSGHTHTPSATLNEDKLLLNPGSITGVWGGKSKNRNPTFGIIHLKTNLAQFEIIIIKNKLIRKVYNFPLSDSAKFIR